MKSSHAYRRFRATLRQIRQEAGLSQIESALKLAGSWWKEPNAQALLALRVARANLLWLSCWTRLSLSRN